MESAASVGHAAIGAVRKPSAKLLDGADALLFLSKSKSGMAKLSATVPTSKALNTERS
jgi:hypothetical protein